MLEMVLRVEYIRKIFRSLGKSLKSLTATCTSSSGLCFHYLCSQELLSMTPTLVNPGDQPELPHKCNRIQEQRVSPFCRSLIPSFLHCGTSCPLCFSLPLSFSISFKNSIDFHFPTLRSQRYTSIWLFTPRWVLSVIKNDWNQKIAQIYQFG